MFKESFLPSLFFLLLLIKIISFRMLTFKIKLNFKKFIHTCEIVAANLVWLGERAAAAAEKFKESLNDLWIIVILIYWSITTLSSHLRNLISFILVESYKNSNDFKEILFKIHKLWLIVILSRQTDIFEFYNFFVFLYCPAHLPPNISLVIT